MGVCHGKPIQSPELQEDSSPVRNISEPTPVPSTPQQPKFPFCSPSPLPGSYKNSPANSSVNSTPLRFLKRPFPPPSPAKHIKALLARRHGSVKPNEAPIPEGSEVEVGLDKNFGFSKQFFSKFELGEEVGRGHFGYTCTAKVKKGDMKGQEVAIKVIPKAKGVVHRDLKPEALAKTLTVNQLYYLREQFSLLGPNKSGLISLQNLKTALLKNSTDTMKDSKVSSLQYRKLDFEEFAAAAISVHQMEALDTWEQHARQGYEFFEKDGNRPIMIEELASTQSEQSDD
ncbi:hypothetical protein C4D60_Mb10t17120 [Musa balbisiana]|uniref:Protein kinase domain-containing protein n=1 Tax=Musa balbisiana TaxID=52838 RepID=A0A4S8IXQ7_MUSBA|nr:hypothetical protein C4D60_Mb10t17120 [Musa balbisiana]